MGNVEGKLHTLVGLVGPAGVGKDTVGGLLVAHHGYRRFAFADRLKVFVHAVDPAMAIAAKVLGSEEAAKRNVPGYRTRLIEVGEAARTAINPDVWVDAIDEDVERTRATHPVVVTDVRHWNEAEWLWDCGGSLVAIYRRGFEAEDAVMKSLLEAADVEIFNAGTMEALAEAVETLSEVVE